MPCFRFNPVALICTLIVVLPSVVFGQGKIISREKEQVLRQLLPNVDDTEVQKILHDDPTTVFYTIREMPAAYQFTAGNGKRRTAFHWAGDNVSGDDDQMFHSARQPGGKGGNANIDFPWNQDTPGGSDRTNTLSSFKALWLPKQPDGRPYPVTWFYENLRNPISGAGFDPGYGWVFPKGTRFFEVLIQKSSEGFMVPFEVRTREKGNTAWLSAAYRPFPEATDLADAIKKLRPDWAQNATLKHAVTTLENDNTVQRVAFIDRNRNRKAISLVAGVDMVPELGDDALVSQLLTQTTYSSCEGNEWKTAASAPSYAGVYYNIVPKNYDGTLVGNSNASCMKCHESTSVHARLFDADRGWYGYVRGSDGILSWNPIEPSAISRGGQDAPVRFRQAFTAAGMLEQYNQARHPQEMYNRFKGLR